MNNYIMLCSLLRIHYCRHVLCDKKECNSDRHANDGAQLSWDLISPTKQQWRCDEGWCLKQRPCKCWYEIRTGNIYLFLVFFYYYLQIVHIKNIFKKYFEICSQSNMFKINTNKKLSKIITDWECNELFLSTLCNIRLTFKGGWMTASNMPFEMTSLIWPTVLIKTSRNVQRNHTCSTVTLEMGK